jgi:hypothetical protein
MYQPPSQQVAGAFQPGVGPSYAGNYVGAETAQDIIDNEHLRLLRIGFFISAAQTAIFIPFGLLYAAMGLMFSQLPSGGSPPPPTLVSWFLGLFGAAFAGLAAVAATLKLLTAIRLKERRSRVMCLIAAGLACVEMPYGTVLGIWTFMVLGRASVRRQFER